MNITEKDYQGAIERYDRIYQRHGEHPDFEKLICIEQEAEKRTLRRSVRKADRERKKKAIEAQKLIPRVVDPFKRYQRDYGMHDMYPSKLDGTCACGCGEKLTGRRTRWATPICVDEPLRLYSIVKGDTTAIRAELYRMDAGACRMCGVISDEWHADHIVPVHKGGGGCDIDNLQTLCIPCHKDKTLIDLI